MPAAEADRLAAAIGSLVAEARRPPDRCSADLQRHLRSTVLLWIERAALSRALSHVTGRATKAHITGRVMIEAARLRRALNPGGTLCSVVWRRKLDNDWMHSAELVVKSFVEKPEESDEPSCGPGPFSMADADTTSAIVIAAGFEDVALRRCDIPISLGATVAAVAFVTALGPAGEVLRLLGDRADDLRPTILAALRENLAQFETPDGIVAPASTWTVTAGRPRRGRRVSHVGPDMRLWHEPCHSLASWRSRPC